MSQYRDRTNQRRMTAILGIVLVVAMGASLILPLIQSQVTQSQNTVQPTEMPTATVPAPIDVSSIQFDQSYIHPSGVFTATIPSDWVPGQGVTNSTEAVVTLRNSAALSLAELRVIQPPDGAADLDAVSAYFDDAWLNSSWREYTSWDEATRTTRDDELVMDFNVASGGQQYIARQLASTDGERIYVARAVFPSNAPEQVRYLVENLKADLHFNEEFANTPISWSSYYDSTTGHIIRYPQTWALTDAAPGAPASIESESGAILRVESSEAAVTSEDEAISYVEQAYPGAEVASVAPVERDGVSGYAVAYSVPTLDGPAESGYVVLLSEDSGTLHVANLTIDSPDVDLNAEEAATEYPELTEVMGTFTLLPAGIGETGSASETEAATE